MLRLLHNAVCDLAEKQFLMIIAYDRTTLSCNPCKPELPRNKHKWSYSQEFVIYTWNFFLDFLCIVLIQKKEKQLTIWSVINQINIATGNGIQFIILSEQASALDKFKMPKIVQLQDCVKMKVLAILQ